MAGPATYDLEIYQGDTFALTLRLRAQNSDGTPGAYVDLTGATPKAQIKDDVGGAVIADLTAALADQATTPGGITLGLSHTATAALTVTVGAGYIWDIQITFPDGTVKTYLRGHVTVDGEITT